MERTCSNCKKAVKIASDEYQCNEENYDTVVLYYFRIGESMNIYMHSEDMPQRCGQCPCFHAETPMYCQAVKPSKEKRIVAPYGLDRPDWCPLVEIETLKGN